MTTITTKKLLLGFLGITAIGLIGSMNTADAAHGLGSWDHDDIEYDCLSSLLNLTFETGSPCSDVSVSVWDNISNSDLDFQLVSSGGDMTVGSQNLVDDWAVNTVGFVDDEVVDSDIVFNTDHTWGDRVGSDWWKWWVKDYKSTAIHEFGHAISLDHDANSDLMHDGHDIGDIYRTPSAHDIAVVQGLY